MNNFKQATKNKVRFYGIKGSLTTEDLWDLGLADLDRMYVEVSKKLKDSTEGSYLSKNVGDEELKIKLSVLQEVMDEKLADQDQAKQRVLNAQKKQRILEAIEKKELGAYDDMALDELKELAESL